MKKKNIKRTFFNWLEIKTACTQTVLVIQQYLHILATVPGIRLFANLHTKVFIGETLMHNLLK